MARIPITGENRWFDDEKALRWHEDSRFDGNNTISVATGSQWEHELLYQTRGGVFVLNCWSDYQSVPETYRIIDDDEAYAWLIKNGLVVPPEILERAGYPVRRLTSRRRPS
jgi:hypothetical protein